MRSLAGRRGQTEVQGVEGWSQETETPGIQSWRSDGAMPRARAGVGGGQSCWLMSARTLGQRSRGGAASHSEGQGR